MAISIRNNNLKRQNNEKVFLEYDDHPDEWEDFGAFNLSGDQFELSGVGGKSTSTRKEVKLTRYKKIS